MPKPLNVLILEDNPIDAELMLLELRRAGFEPDWQLVDNEKDFAARLKPELDLILSDYYLPQFAGQEALHLLNKSGFDIPCIVVSAEISEELAMECMRAGADDYLMKDRLRRLGAAVNNSIKKKVARDEKQQAQHEIMMLLDLSRQAGAETNLNDLLFFIADQIVKIIPPAEAASIFFYDKERKVVKVQAWAGFKDSDIKELEFEVDGSQVGRFFHTRKPALIKDVSLDPDFKPSNKPSRSSIKSQIVVPLF
ncbi:MAG: response regulator, partial [Anaerolineaceae bacterium]|nr:response regulator [Anaerolineaceae bacterium]